MTSFRTNWEQYRSAVADYREITEDPDDTTALDRQVTHATRLFNITDQGITNKLTKLIKDEIEGEKQAKDIKPTLPAIPEEPPVDQSTQTALPEASTSQAADPDSSKSPIEEQANLSPAKSSY